MKKLLTIALLLAVSACTPANERYCSSYGIAKNNAEYPACNAYFFKMDNWFRSDLNICQSKAGISFPDYMYDHARYADTEVIDHFGRVHEGTTLIEPDYIRNQSLDIERRKIIMPCMQQKGWNNPDNWQAGRADAPQSPPRF